MSSVGTPNQLHARVSVLGSNKNAYHTNHQNGVVASSSTARAAATTTTATTTTTTNHTSKSTVDDAKYDRRMKQRLLLHTQRQRRRQKMIFDCRQLCLRILLLVTIVLAILYYIISYIFLFTTISSSSTSTSSLLLSNPASLLQQRRSYSNHHQQQAPPLLQRFIEPPHILPSTAPLDLQYQQLRLFFLSSTTLTNQQHNFKNNNDLLSEEQQQQEQDQSSPQMILRKKQLIDVLESWLEQEDYEIQNNLGSIHPRYTRPYLLPPLHTNQDDNSIDRVERRTKKLRKKNNLPYMKATQLGNFFRVYRLTLPISNPITTKSDTKTNAFLKFRKKWKKERRNTKGDDNTNTNDNENDDNTKKESPPRTKKNTKNPMKWQDEYDALIQQYGSRDKLPGPIVDYTNPTLYEYPTKPTTSQQLSSPPMDGSYPKLQSLQQILQKWPQNEDYNMDQYTTIQETLQHFDYQNPNELQMAKQYRDAELPFKLYNIPDIIKATPKWQKDDYVGQMFGSVNSVTSNWLGERSAGTARYKENDGTIVHIPTARGTAQESRNHYFAFYVAKQWDVETMGLTPTRNIQDWNYTIWSQHAIYADAVRLTHDKPHFYWQSGVSPEERHESSKHWTFISRDLPMFSTTKDNFFVFHVDEQKGIQCRFGERGVVAATHFDSGRNMVAMINGAKRYILSPPNQCSKLGIFKNKRSPIYRHSLLNFGHIQFLQDNEHDSTTKEKTTTTTTITNTSTIPKMSPEEREWLQRAASSQAVETVLKQGEVLYIPSHWFHYIVSLQKSAQCNVRSGIDVDGTLIFGGRNDVDQCTD